MINTRLLLTLFILLSYFSNSFGQTTSSKRTFTFTLNGTKVTSAGVFKKDGTLVRTLWNNQTFNAGTYTKEWNGLSDRGEFLTDSEYSVKVLTNNVKYEWEGVIGNTSNNLTGSKVHHHPEGAMYDMAITNGYAYYAVGYDEGYSGHLKFSLQNPQDKLYVGGDPKKGMITKYVCTDGNYVYWGGIEEYARKGKGSAFVMATKVSDDSEVQFSYGQSYQCPVGKKYKSVIGLMNTTSSVKAEMTGIAVQKKGKFLFIARGRMSALYVLNKTTGEIIQKLEYDSVKNIKVDNEDNLWFSQGTHGPVKKYTINTNGTLNSTGLKLTGVTTPYAIGFSPDNTTIVVIDGDKKSQQLKAFNVNTGSLEWTFGKSGGYFVDAAVTNDKFFFWDTKDLLRPEDRTPFILRTFIAFQPNGSFWVGDQGNYRAMHFSAGRTFIENIMNIGYFYSAAVDVNNPKRVFANYLEYEVDYSKDLDKGSNGSWKLVRNWAGGSDFYHDDQYARLRDVTTFSNGRTYCFLVDKYKNQSALVELPQSGILRFTGQLFSSRQKGAALNPDGSVTMISTTVLGKSAIWKKYPLQGFDAKNNPIYGSAINLGSSPAITGEDPIANGTGSVMPNAVTSSGIIVTFNPDNDLSNTRSYGYHLGGIKLNDNKWLWRTSYSTSRTYMGEFPSDGSFDLGNRVKAYAGAFARVVDHNIFWSYHGEFWKSSQTNKWNHFYDNGLMVGQFGITKPEALKITGEASPMMAGNVLTGNVVKVGNTLYAYHNDESFHGGIGRWKITGLNTIEEQTVELNFGSSNTFSPGLNLMEGLPDDDTLKNNTYGWTRMPEKDILIDRSINWWTNIIDALTPNQNKDLLIKLSTTEGKPKKGIVARDLGNYSNLKQWSITGTIAYTLQAEKDTSYIQILDDNNKVIAQIERNFKFFFNRKAILNSESYAANGKILQGFNDIKITADESGISFTYATYPTVKVSVFNKSSNWRNPKTLRFYLSDPGGSGHGIDISNFRFSIVGPDNYTPDPPSLIPNYSAGTLTANHPLGGSEIVVSENDGSFEAYSGKIRINVLNTSRPEGYWKFKTKAATGRKESAVINSPAFNMLPSAPTLTVDDDLNILVAKHDLGTSEILVSENGGSYSLYEGQINVGNVTRAAGYWKFKIKAATLRKESEVVLSPAFTFSRVTTEPPTILADDKANTMKAVHPLGTSQILVSLFNAPYKPYTGEIFVGNIARAAGAWKFKVKATDQRTESAAVASPEFKRTPPPPQVFIGDATNFIKATHLLGASEIVVSVNDQPFIAYTGTINVGNVERKAGYYKFKIKEAEGRSESEVVNSPAFTYTSTPNPPTIIADDRANTIAATHSLGNSQILFSEGGKGFEPYKGYIKVGDRSLPAGYFKFKIKSGTLRFESAVVNSPAFKKGTSSSSARAISEASAISTEEDSLVTSVNLETSSKDSLSEFSKLLVSESLAELKPAEKFNIVEQPKMTLYPNPVVGNTVNLKLENFEVGKFTVRIIGSYGQVFMSKMIELNSPNSQQTLNFNSNLAKGIYIIEIVGKTKSVRKSILKG